MDALAPPRRATSTGLILALLRKDLRLVWRDGFLLLLATYPLVLAVAFRLAVPFVPIEHLYLYMAPVVICFAGNLLGTVLGYSLIEERETRTWLLLRVLPLPDRTLFGYLFGAGVALSFPLALLSALLYGIVPVQPVFFVLMCASSATIAPLMMLLLGSLASNKIEGLAIAKALGMAAMLPALAFWLGPGWQLTIAWNPFYWLYLGLLHAYVGPEQVLDLAILWPAYSPWLLALAPTGLCIAGSWALARVYRRRAA